MSTTMRIHGRVAPGFEGVRDAFARSLDTPERSGAACAVVVAGETVVDLWGGTADPSTGAPWQAGTTTLVFSVTKGVVATLVNLLAERGELDPDMPVAHYWPEFGAAGKGRITVRTLLAHRAGLPVLDRQLPVAELLAGAAAAELAGQAPLWRPEDGHGYHALTWGWLVGELLRRVTGSSTGELVTRYLAEPLGLNLRLGVPAPEGADIAQLIDDVPRPDELRLLTEPAARAVAERLLAARSDPDSLLSRALTTNGVLPTPHAATWNAPEVVAAEIPAANLVSDARSLARLYGACVAPSGPLLTVTTTTGATQVISDGPDRVTLRSTRFGLGYQLANDAVPMLGPGSFGHPGAGGSTAFADPRHATGFAFVTNQLRMSLLGDPRAAGVLDALRSALVAADTAPAR